MAPNSWFLLWFSCFSWIAPPQVAASLWLISSTLKRIDLECFGQFLHGFYEGVEFQFLTLSSSLPSLLSGFLFIINRCCRSHAECLPGLGQRRWCRFHLALLRLLFLEWVINGDNYQFGRMPRMCSGYTMVLKATAQLKSELTANINHQTYEWISLQ